MISQKQTLKVKTVSNKYKFKSKFDTNGSYTGVDYKDSYSTPVQDADDL